LDVGALSTFICIFDRLNGDVSKWESALANLRIPERFRIGVAEIATLTDGSFTDLVAALKDSGLSNTAADLASKIEDAVPSISLSDREAMIAAISAMQGVMKAAHVDSRKFASDVWDALDSDSPELTEDLDEDTLKARMFILLNETSIHLKSAKVSELRSEIERSFCGARVLTDVRAAFGDDATKRPAMTILHTLEIMFHDDIGRHREFYVVLEDNDLAILKDAIERAIQKKATLVDLLKKADFELFE
jgi:hypothetical protein